MDQLYFKSGNAKLANTVTFNLPAGHTCPYAVACKSSADRVTGKVTDGPKCKFRCFSATGEARSTALRKRVWQNQDALKAVGVHDVQAMAELIDSELPEAGLVRMHVNGDFFTDEYFQAWCEIARRRPGHIEWVDVEGCLKPKPVGTIFYAYTKAVHVMTFTDLPSNLKLTASHGGSQDHAIDELGLKHAKVVYSEQEALDLGLEIDHDDTHAWARDESFALLIHGTQPAGSDAGKALSALRKTGWTGYNKSNKKL